MNILRIIASVDPEHGGPVEGLRRSAMLMAEAGHATEVVTLDDPQAPFVTDFPLPVHGQGPVPSRYGYTRRLAGWIADNAHRFDAAVVHGLWNHASIGGWQGLRRARLAYVVFTHGMMDPWFRKAYPLKHWAKQAFWLVAQGRVLEDAHRVLFTSQEEMRLAANAFFGPGYRGEVVAYGAADAPGRPREQHHAFHARLPGLKQRPYLLFLGRIHPKKGCDLLVEAFPAIASRHPEIDLVIAGPDPVGLRARLESMARELGVAARIHWPGMLEGDAKWGAFRGAEAFVLPSHQENFGIVVAEAMACGTPVLVTDKVNIWREVEASGGMVESDTLEGTAALLSRFLALSPAERDTMRIHARTGYEKHFALAGAVRDLERILLATAAVTAHERH